MTRLPQRVPVDVKLLEHVASSSRSGICQSGQGSVWTKSTFDVSATVEPGPRRGAAGPACGLDSNNAAAGPVAKTEARAFSTTVTDPGVAKASLDARVETLDDVSNEQIGAPAA